MYYVVNDQESKSTHEKIDHKFSPAPLKDTNSNNSPKLPDQQPDNPIYYTEMNQSIQTVTELNIKTDI